MIIDANTTNAKTILLCKQAFINYLGINLSFFYVNNIKKIKIKNKNKKTFYLYIINHKEKCIEIQCTLEHNKDSKQDIDVHLFHVEYKKGVFTLSPPPLTV